MKLYYVAGPFSADTREGVEANIRAAEAVGLALARAGYAPVVPHSNTANPAYEHVQPYQFWIDATLELLKRCDALVTVPGYAQSRGACGEVLWAYEHNMPVYHDVEGIRA